MARLRACLAWMAIVCLLTSVSCRRRDAKPEPAPSPLDRMEKLETKDERLLVGSALAFERLAVFPLFSREQHDIGAVMSLQEALAAGKAEVREDGSATVAKLSLENKGEVQIYALAGTVVKGGNQDRQIGQDFVVAPRQTVSVDAFCVEQGRWSATRGGHATKGKFEALDQLATSQVRAAGQYEKNQGQVWAKVGEVNAQSGKSSPSSSLLASLDDAEIGKRRAALARRVSSRLEQIEPAGDLVGLAYAVDGRIRGARWFSSHRLFETFREILINTAASDAITAPAETARGTPAPSAVVAFVKDVEKTDSVERRSTDAQNANEYKQSKRGYGAATKLGKPRPVSKDYVAK